MNYRISVNKRPLLDSYVSQHRLRIGIHVDKLAPPMKLEGDNVLLEMAVKLAHCRRIQCHCSVEGQLHKREIKKTLFENHVQDFQAFILDN